MSITPQNVLLSNSVSGSGPADLSEEGPVEFLYKWSQAVNAIDKGSALEGAKELIQAELFYYNAASKALKADAGGKLSIAFGGYNVKAIKALAVELKALHEKKILETQMNEAVAKAGKGYDVISSGTDASKAVFT